METSDSSLASAQQAQASMATFTPMTFTSPVSFKRDEDNFIPWKHQALACIKANKLKDHLNKKKVPVRFASEEDQVAEVETQEYLNWEQQDQHLVAWLLASMDSSFANCMVECEFAHEIWSNLEEYFASRSKSKIKRLKAQIKTIKKQGSTTKYLANIKKVIDSLAALGAPICKDDFVEAVLDGLNKDYNAFITMAMSKSDSLTMSELKTLLLAQEDLIE